MLKGRFIVLWLIMANALLISASEEKQAIAEAPTARKLGKHHLRRIIASPGPGPSPTEASTVGESGGGAGEEVIASNHRHHHHRSSVEKSVAGGGAIVGVLAAVFLAAIFCYIRATRRRPVQPTDSFSNGRKMLESASAARPL